MVGVLPHLVQRSRRLLIAAAATSSLAGVFSVLLLTQINAALTASQGDARTESALRFAIFAVIAMATQMVASVMFERLSQSAHASLRGFISGRVLTADFRRLEEVGSPKVLSALSDHSAKVAEFFTSVPTILTNAIIVIGCLVYMAWLSWPVFLLGVLVIALGSLGYHLAHLKAIRHLDEASREQDRLFDHFRSLVEGAKELRLNHPKSQRFSADVLGASVEAVRRERAHGMSIFVASASWGNFLIYAFIGLVLFVLVGDAPDRAKVMTGFALVFVYMVAPLEMLLVNLPKANLARSSAQRIDDVIHGLPGADSRVPAEPPRAVTVALEGVQHRYYHEASDEVFTLGPIDLRFEPGQLTFLVGGNGSGKTTLAKLIVGLYQPEAGRIVVNGNPVDDEDRIAYRQCFSAIFSDFHLFDRLLAAPGTEVDTIGNRLLEKLHLRNKVQVRDGAFTTRALSQGQRKRLALVVSYLEDRPFLVFDEWAADQDPVFKDVFYRELLPELRAQGKTVLVISHDDRYFDLADQVIRMENGKVVNVG
ncbi:cyclic peptide export ABC transporter [Roseateles sp. BYS180W]|uniref:Cyclic peptide export ABC transporter n=1 Tax=Roseateles rivi TaxID=3299028 RepID=A0ABW7FZP8_9BURK